MTQLPQTEFCMVRVTRPDPHELFIGLDHFLPKNIEGDRNALGCMLVRIKPHPEPPFELRYHFGLVHSAGRTMHRLYSPHESTLQSFPRSTFGGLSSTEVKQQKWAVTVPHAVATDFVLESDGAPFAP